jgi:peptide/nickel transport system substrate-binding protein
LIIDSLDWATFYADVDAGRFELYGLSWTALKDPDIYRRTMHSSLVPPHGFNRGFYADTTMDSWLDSASTSTDVNQRTALLRAIQRWSVYDLPYVPLWFEDQTTALRDDVQGYHSDADGSLDALVTTYRMNHTHAH